MKRLCVAAPFQHLQLTYEASAINGVLFLRSGITLHPGTKLGKTLKTVHN